MSTANDVIRKAEEAAAAETLFSQNYFDLIKAVMADDNISGEVSNRCVTLLYGKVKDQILYNGTKPAADVKFGTSGWRGILGRDLFCKSVAQVTLAVVDMYKTLSADDRLREPLGVRTLEDAKKRGCVVGFDNRFCGELLAAAAVNVLRDEGFTVHYAGESTTGVLSASVLKLKAAFSINFTPSHNPLEYGGLKYNAADGGPAAASLTSYITRRSNQIIEQGIVPDCIASKDLDLTKVLDDTLKIDSFSLWQDLVRENGGLHGLVLDDIIKRIREDDDFVVAVDSVHGASRLHFSRIFDNWQSPRLIHLRGGADVTFGGVAPEPSSENMRDVVELLQERNEKYKLGAIIDPDGDRIRFTDGKNEISMNQFGAMAYHFLHEYKKKKGMVAKTVATSNLANIIAEKLGEEVFEPRVGFKEFKPVVGKALICFEESDGISAIGHTPEKDAYIGLLLALDMIIGTGKNLSEYLIEIENDFGHFYPDRDGIEVSQKGEELLAALSRLESYRVGSSVDVGGVKKKIKKIIDIDGRKMIFDDGSWLMIRPSGTEPKVRFYVEARTSDGASSLVDAAKKMLKEIGLI